MEVVEAGQEVTRDIVPVKRTTQRAVRLATRLPSVSRWAAADQHAFYRDFAAKTIAEPVAWPRPTLHNDEAVTTSPDAAPSVAVYSNYPHFNAANMTLPGYTFVADPATAGILMLATHVRDFAALPANALVNQFPYEGE